MAHKSQRNLINMGRLCRPRRLHEGSTHLGNINNFSHDSTEFVRITEFSVEESILAKSGLNLAGIKRSVGQLSSQTSSKDGRLGTGGSA